MKERSRGSRPNFVNPSDSLFSSSSGQPYARTANRPVAARAVSLSRNGGIGHGMPIPVGVVAGGNSFGDLPSLSVV